jgi:hypothetical protein
MPLLEVLIKPQPTELAEYKDILVYAITITTVIVAALSVIAVYLLGKTYADHVTEIQLISSKYAHLEKQYQEAQLLHRRTTRRLMVGFDRVVRLFILRTRIDEMAAALQALRGQGTWLGRVIPDSSRPDYEGRLLSHMGKCQKQYKARELEILCISSEFAYRGGYLRSLVESVGDEDTLRFLHEYSETLDEPAVRDTYLSMIGELAFRLRSPQREAMYVDSTLWTGRTD